MELLNQIEEYLFLNIQENLLYFSILFAAVIGKLKESSKRNILSAWLMYFIGTFFHELMHLLASLLTLGKPTWFSIFPSRNKDENGNTIGYTLGHVKSNNVRWFNVFIISMAPLLLLPLSFFVYENFFMYVEQNLYTYLMYVFLIISFLFSSIPSSVDFKNVLVSNTIELNVLPGIVIILIIYFFNIYQYFSEFFNMILGWIV